jgi:hypothetical protein
MKTAHFINHNFQHNSYSINQNRRRTHHEQKQQQSEDLEAEVDRPIFPSASELREAARFEHASNRVNKRTTIRDHFGLAKELAAARRAEKSIDSEIRKVLKGGGVGSLPDVKGDNIGRFCLRIGIALHLGKTVIKLTVSMLSVDGLRLTACLEMRFRFSGILHSRQIGPSV